MEKLKVVLIAFIVIVCPVSGQGQEGQSHIGKAVYWTSPFMDIMVVPDLAKFEVIIADLENWVNNPESLKTLKKLNPGLKLLMYVNPMELYHKRMGGRSIGWELYNKIKEPPYDQWWFRTTKAEPVIFYKSLPLWMMNLSVDCPEVEGTRWNQYFARFIVAKISQWEPKPDGLFGDNPTCYIYWINRELLKTDKVGFIDSNRDGLPDDETVLDQNWCDGQKEFYSIIGSAMGKDFLVITNKGELNLMRPQKLVDGIMFEEFPNNYLGDKTAGGWYQSMDNYLEAGNRSIVHSIWPADKDHFRFVFYSAMLGNGYFMVGHNNRNWYPEYDEAKKLGRPVGETAKSAVYWYRGFERGAVFVWPMTRRVEVVFFNN